MTVLQE